MIHCIKGKFVSLSTQKADLVLKLLFAFDSPLPMSVLQLVKMCVCVKLEPEAMTKTVS